MSAKIDISQNVKSALNCGKPVTALESCVFTHGLPREYGPQTALEMETIIRDQGVEPATIGVIGGKIKVGLTKDEIENLASREVAKLAARDLPFAVAQGLDGGTTVSASARIAAAVGICVLATGGIGGVHADASETADVSADLWELVNTPITVICSGPKAITDLRKTAEWLETHGVPVYGWRTDELPAFYSARSGVSIPKVADENEFADLTRVIRSEFGLRCGIVLAVPIPEEHDINLSAELAQALCSARADGISGKNLTPYVLHKLVELTGGKSIEANLALLRSNAFAAARVASALFKHAERRVGFLG